MLLENKLAKSSLPIKTDCERSQIWHFLRDASNLCQSTIFYFSKAEIFNMLEDEVSLVYYWHFNARLLRFWSVVSMLIIWTNPSLVVFLKLIVECWVKKSQYEMINLLQQMVRCFRLARSVREWPISIRASSENTLGLFEMTIFIVLSQEIYSLKKRPRVINFGKLLLKFAIDCSAFLEISKLKNQKLNK